MLEEHSNTICVKMATRHSKEQTISHLEKATRLPREEVVHLMERFNDLCKNRDGKLSRMDFRDELNRHFNITDDILMDRVFRAFDQKSTGNLRQEDYVIGIGKFINGTNEDYLRLCFSVYDLNGDGYISRDEMFQLLKPCLVKAPTEEDPDEMVKELVEIVMKKLDADHDGKVSYNDFKEAVSEDKLMLESLGKCLPDDKCKLTFREMIRVLGNGQYNPTSNVNISQQRQNQRRHGHEGKN